MPSFVLLPSCVGIHHVRYLILGDLRCLIKVPDNNGRSKTQKCRENASAPGPRRLPEVASLSCALARLVGWPREVLLNVESTTDIRSLRFDTAGPAKLQEAHLLSVLPHQRPAVWRQKNGAYRVGIHSYVSVPSVPPLLVLWILAGYTNIEHC